MNRRQFINNSGNVAVLTPVYRQLFQYFCLYGIILFIVFISSYSYSADPTLTKYHVKGNYFNIHLGMTSAVNYKASTDLNSDNPRTVSFYFPGPGFIGRLGGGLSIYKTIFFHFDFSFMHISYDQRSTGGISNMKDEYRLMRIPAFVGFRAYLIVYRPLWLYVEVGPELCLDIVNIKYDSSKNLSDDNFVKFFIGGSIGLGFDIPLSKSLNLITGARYHIVQSSYLDVTTGLSFRFD